MAESHVVTALVAKRAEMAGLIEHHKKEMARLAGDLTHLDATLKLFSPEIDLRTLRAKAHRKYNVNFKAGECQRMVLDIFREANGDALSSRAITDALIARKELEATPTLIKHLQQSVLTVLHRLEKSEILVSARRDGGRATWRVA